VETDVATSKTLAAQHDALLATHSAQISKLQQDQADTQRRLTGSEASISALFI
jgi:hypothetical protein